MCTVAADGCISTTERQQSQKTILDCLYATASLEPL